jgi:hypothetical protein
MEQFIRGQLFWGFYPAVSTAGGMESGDPLNRYFLHPELYERDRPLFVKHIPVIRELSTAGWEPVTHASCSPDGDIERFGDFARGDVLLTVRGSNGGALESEIELDLVACGLARPILPVDSVDVLADQPLTVERGPDPGQARFEVSLSAGEVGVYRFQVAPAARADFDVDGDVDLTDFGHFQACLTGASKPQDDPACQDARLDGDSDVDDDDLWLLLGCLSGKDVPADPDCADW